MGKILSIELAKIMGVDDLLSPVLDITNWRIMREMSQGLVVVINTCERFFIPNLTAKLFHEISNSNEAVEMEFEFLQQNLPCLICHGRGLLDWIDNITKEVKYVEGVQETFKRNPSVSPRSILEYEVSTPMLDESQSICKTCQGTGLHMFNENAYLLKLESERGS